MTMAIVGISVLVLLLFIFMMITAILMDILEKEREENRQYYKMLRREYDHKIEDLKAEIEVRDVLLDAYGIRR